MPRAALLRIGMNYSQVRHDLYLDCFNELWKTTHQLAKILSKPADCPFVPNEARTAWEFSFQHRDVEGQETAVLLDPKGDPAILTITPQVVGYNRVEFRLQMTNGMQTGRWYQDSRNDVVDVEFIAQKVLEPLIRLSMR